MLKKSKLHYLLVYSNSNHSSQPHHKDNPSKHSFTSFTRNYQRPNQHNLHFSNKSFQKRTKHLSLSNNANYSFLRQTPAGRNKYYKDTSPSFDSSNKTSNNIENNVNKLTLKSFKRTNFAPVERNLSSELKITLDPSFFDEHMRSFSEYKYEVNKVICEKYQKFKGLRNSVERLKNSVNLLRIGGEKKNELKQIDSPKLLTKIKKIKAENKLDIPSKKNQTNLLIKENQMKLELYIKEGKILKDELSKERSKITEIENEMIRLRNNIKMMEKDVFTVKYNIQSFKKSMVNKNKMERVKLSISHMKERIDKNLKIKYMSDNSKENSREHEKDSEKEEEDDDNNNSQESQEEEEEKTKKTKKLMQKKTPQKQINPAEKEEKEEVKKGWEKKVEDDKDDNQDDKNEDDDIPEVEEERMKISTAPETFANKLISLQELEKHSGNLKLPNDLSSIKNMMLLTTAVKPKDQVFEKDEEWNYEVLHTEITQITRAQYGEYFQN